MPDQSKQCSAGGQTRDRAAVEGAGLLGVLSLGGQVQATQLEKREKGLVTWRW